MVMQNCEDQIFIDFEKICPISHGRQALPMLEKLSSSLDRPAATDKAKHFANSRIQRYPDPAFGFF